MQGKWKLVTHYVDDKEKKFEGDVYVEINDRHIEFTAEKGSVPVTSCNGQLLLDPSRTPRQIQVQECVQLNIDMYARNLVGIYVFAGKNLIVKVARNATGAEPRPKDITPAKDNSFMWILEPVKPDTTPKPELKELSDIEKIQLFEKRLQILEAEVQDLRKLLLERKPGEPSANRP